MFVEGDFDRTVGGHSEKVVFLMIMVVSLHFTVMGVQGSSRLCYSTGTFLSDDDAPVSNTEAVEIDDDDFLPEKPDLQLQSVDPRKGWNFRGVHKVCALVESPISVLKLSHNCIVYT